ncbi:hypothetical protein GCM10010411_87180 [Actinomadura fulvescens]|uniref:Uncharacterized protein n=1 Tax=Actinomadura fulvescens TaxID=46160 RepID=A0ABN3QTV8_9ACTN
MGRLEFTGSACAGGADASPTASTMLMPAATPRSERPIRNTSRLRFIIATPSRLRQSKAAELLEAQEHDTRAFGTQKKFRDACVHT